MINVEETIIIASIEEVAKKKIRTKIESDDEKLQQNNIKILKNDSAKGEYRSVKNPKKN